ncbi:hypothetical protein GMO_11610 [Gluconobacter morbifer G707]|uniref:Phage terminase small subunit n=2 Tax=Gluconobacter TaxID=441 RepID=G6XIW1_9PROT|nr:hypothetical protein GMO_11610 [Gluconobacter morbifer G707]
MGVLTSADGAALEALCLAISDEWEARDSLARSITYQKLVDDTDESGKKTSRLEEHTIAEGGSQTYVTIGKSGPMVRMRPEVAAIADANRRVAMWLARFGLTPADRSRVGAAEEKKENPFADLG